MKTKISVRVGMGPEVTFETRLHESFRKNASDHVEHVRQVLTEWAEVTGLAWGRMPYEDLSDLPGNELHGVLNVTNPLENRPKALISWLKP